MSDREYAPLRPSEWRVLARVAQGESDQQIAVALATSPPTVRAHLARIYRVLPLSTAGNPRVAAALWYVRHCGERRARRPAERPLLGTTEWRVLERLARGESNKQIAGALGLGYQTIKNHLGAAYRRLPLGVVANPRVTAAIWYERVGRAQYEQGA